MMCRYRYWRLHRKLRKLIVEWIYAQRGYHNDALAYSTFQKNYIPYRGRPMWVIFQDIQKVLISVGAIPKEEDVL